ncbi:hypothetical protein F4824DRAFT_511375 [Ustulina deusta]|nr:hypothetical protein F4824DRAFT_511375 [Ustulina deusta]
MNRRAVINGLTELDKYMDIAKTELDYRWDKNVTNGQDDNRVDKMSTRQAILTLASIQCTPPLWLLPTSSSTCAPIRSGSRRREKRCMSTALISGQYARARRKTARASPKAQEYLGLGTITSTARPSVPDPKPRIPREATGSGTLFRSAKQAPCQTDKSRLPTPCRSGTELACPRRAFSVREIKLILARLLSNFGFKFPEGTSRPNDLFVDEKVFPIVAVQRSEAAAQINDSFNTNEDFEALNRHEITLCVVGEGDRSSITQFLPLVAFLQRDPASRIDPLALVVGFDGVAKRQSHPTKKINSIHRPSKARSSHRQKSFEKASQGDHRKQPLSMLISRTTSGARHHTHIAASHETNTKVQQSQRQQVLQKQHTDSMRLCFSDV